MHTRSARLTLGAQIRLCAPMHTVGGLNRRSVVPMSVRPCLIRFRLAAGLHRWMIK
jgi:hypothetical protein